MDRIIDRINRVIEYFEAQSYLQLGVARGDIFFHIRAGSKTGVGERFAFNPADFISESVILHSGKIDDFFAAHAANTGEGERDNDQNHWDVIFFNTATDFRTVLKMFEESRSWSHDKSIWFLGRTIPGDPYDSLPDEGWSRSYRKQARLPDGEWCGENYKLVLAVHDFYPDMSYCTVINNGLPMTVVWKSVPVEERRALFSSVEEIARLNYFDMLKFAKYYMPVTEDMLLPIIGMWLNPVYSSPDDAWKRLIWSRIKVQKVVQQTSLNFPNKPQLWIMKAYSVILKRTTSLFHYERFLRDPLEFFQKAKHPMNKVVRSFLKVTGPWPKS